MVGFDNHKDINYQFSLGMQEHKHINNLKDGHCKHCGIKMIGHQTLEEWQAVVDKNRAYWKKQQEKEITGFEGLNKLLGTHVAIGCLLDPNEKDAANSKNRRYV